MSRETIIVWIALAAGGCTLTHAGLRDAGPARDGFSPIDAAVADAGPVETDAGEPPMPTSCRYELWIDDDLALRVATSYDAASRLLSVDAVYTTSSATARVRATAWDERGRVLATETRASPPPLIDDLRRRRAITYDGDRLLSIATEHLRPAASSELRFVWDRDVALEVEEHRDERLGHVTRYDVELEARRATATTFVVDWDGRRDGPQRWVVAEWNDEGGLTRVETRQAGGPCTEVELARDSEGYLQEERHRDCATGETTLTFAYMFEESAFELRSTRLDVSPMPAGRSVERRWSSTAPRLRERERVGAGDFGPEDPYTLYLGCGLSPRRPRSAGHLLEHPDWFRLAGAPLLDESLPHEEGLSLVQEFL